MVCPVGVCAHPEGDGGLKAGPFDVELHPPRTIAETQPLRICVCECPVVALDARPGGKAELHRYTRILAQQ
jgi:hypothetical protein